MTENAKAVVPDGLDGDRRFRVQTERGRCLHRTDWMFKRLNIC